MDLATHQQSVRDLVLGAAVRSAHPDAYIRAVQDSANLAIVRDIGVWWKSFGIERWCNFTSALLRQRGTFEETVEAFCRQPGLSSFFEVTGNLFLAELAESSDPLLRSLAAFELALLQAAKRELGDDVVVDWEHDPDEVLGRLLAGQPADQASRGSFRTLVSERLPRLYERC